MSTGSPADDGVRLGRVGRPFWVREQSYVERARTLSWRATGIGSPRALPLRSYAAQSGLGWIGRNGMLITPQLGRYATLAVLLTDMEVEAPIIHADRCGELSPVPAGLLYRGAAAAGWFG